MIKHVILIIVFSVVAVVFRTQLSHILDGLIYVHNYIAMGLHMIFSDATWGRLLQDVISLLLIPFVAGIIVATAFWLVKHFAMPHIAAVIWVLWLILLTTMVAQTHMAPPSASNKTAVMAASG